MARWTAALALLHVDAFAENCVVGEDEHSMLQMPITENTLQAANDASECRCPAYFEHECRAEEAYGCVWTAAGSSNGPWCQCREILEPGWQAPPRPVTPPIQQPNPPSPPVTLPVQASWDNHFAAFGGQDVDRILLDYTEQSVITVYDQTTGTNTVYQGLAGVRTCFEGLFASLFDTSDLAAPVITVKEATAHEPGSVFLIWKAPASGYSEATDTFIFDSSAKILWQNVVVSYLDPRGDGSIVRQDDTEAPTGSGPVHDGWANHFAAFGGQDVDRVLLDYVEESVITVYNDADGTSTTFRGLAGVRSCFEGLFASLWDTSDLAAPIVHVEEAVGDKAGQVFLIWSARASGYHRATDTFLFNDEGKITLQYVVVHYLPVQEYEAVMGSYPGYSGDLHFTGSVSVDQSGDNIILSWHLSGLEAELCAAPPQGVGNACGIHIHSGSTCDDSSGVGGHYYHEDLDADPWSPVVYTPDAFGDSTSSGNTIAIGHSLSDVLGRAIVVHDHTGGRVACGTIHAAPAAKASMGSYPGYSGDLHFTGSVSVDESGNDLRLSWRLGGLEAELCAVPPEGVGNACGIHIHSGSTCDDSSGVGGHYYHEDLDADPWSPVVYTPDASGGSVSAGNTIAIGYSLSDVLGRAIVVHDHTGGRVACGIIQPAGRLLPTAIMGSYPGYSGDLHSTGSVSVDQSGNDLRLSWHLSGLEAELCAVPPEGVGNACGIHIHSGSTCDDSSGVGGHYYHEDLDADPWSPVVYTPDAFGDSTSSGNTIAIGYSLSDVRGRAIVVHDHTGGRVACGIIQ